MSKIRGQARPDPGPVLWLEWQRARRRRRSPRRSHRWTGVAGLGV